MQGLIRGGLEHCLLSYDDPESSHVLHNLEEPLHQLQGPDYVAAERNNKALPSIVADARPNSLTPDPNPTIRRHCAMQHIVRIVIDCHILQNDLS